MLSVFNNFAQNNLKQYKINYRHNDDILGLHYFTGNTKLREQAKINVVQRVVC